MFWKLLIETFPPQKKSLFYCFLTLLLSAKDEKERMQIMQKAYGSESSGQSSSMADSILNVPATATKRKADALDKTTSEYYDSLLGLWIASTSLPVSIVDNPHMIRFVGALNNKVFYLLFKSNCQISTTGIWIGVSICKLGW